MISFCFSLPIKIVTMPLPPSVVVSESAPLVVEAGLGLAPGDAFAPEARGWLRWCFASKDTQRLVEGVERLRGWLAKQPTPGRV